MKEQVSIVMPVYNTAPYLKNSYLSAVNQSYPLVELIIINDASQDNSADVIHTLMQASSKANIKYIELEQNGGVGAARNIGLDMAQGDYVLFLDSDDWINSNHVACMITAMQLYEADIGICGVLNEYNNFQSSTPRYFYDTNMVIEGDYALKLLSRAMQNDIFITPMVGNKMYQKSFLTNNHLSFLSSTSCEDDVFTFLTFTLNPTVALVSQTQTHYYQRASSTTHDFKKGRIDDLIHAFDYIKKHLHHHALYRKYHFEYKSFFERCILTTCQSLEQANMETEEKKRYLLYLLHQLIEHFSLKEIINYLDIDRIYRFLGVEY